MSTLSYLQENYGIKKIGDITWSHAVNSREKAAKYTGSPDIMFIESDVRMDNNGEVILAHPPDVSSDLSLVELIERIAGFKQGLKLDFKDEEAVVPSLLLLQKAGLKQPVMLNADVLGGNRAAEPKINSAGFVAETKKYYPLGILSLGWTTNQIDPYTKDNIDDMLRLCENIGGEVTHPVRACLLEESWSEVQRLIQIPSRTLSVWNNEPVAEDLQAWIKNNTDPRKTFYDFIDKDKNPIRFW